MSVPSLKTVAVTLFKNGVAEIAHNRPKRYNALSPQSYEDWLAAIKWAATSDSVKVVVLTGKGKYYTSGQELVLSKVSEEEFERRCSVTEELISQMIRFPKLLIGAVNGPSIGFGTTTLALCDVVYSVPEATFATPFMKLAFCAEGCSSVLFPKIMGPSRANEMLLLGEVFTAQKMADCGFVSRLIESDKFSETVHSIANRAAQYSPTALKRTKGLIRNVDIETLEKVNKDEMAMLRVCMKSEESMEYIQRFLEAAQKKKAKL
ncbi:ClpP/crotonase-like domain-containing protein [Sporodiniella umbellata]|nr:ClpP/crotonase-like domain-containing protein [Sporodiniella umbellata]